MEVTVSVLIVIRNVEQYISSCLSSVLAQTFRNFEIIIVDDLSTDGTKQKILAFNDNRIVYVINKKIAGRTKSRNISIKLAKGKYLFFTDGDCCVDKNWIEDGIQHLENPDILGVEGKTIYVSENYKPNGSDVIVENSTPGHYMTCNIAYKRTLFDKIGVFDERFTHLEDRDFGLRVIKQGPILFSEKMLVYHQRKSVTPKQFLKAADPLSNRVLLYKKGDRAVFLKRIAMPTDLIKMMSPPIFLANVVTFKVRKKGIPQLFPYMYFRIILERLHFWHMCAKERVVLL